MSIRRVQVKADGVFLVYKTFPINPIEFDNPNGYAANVTTTVDGYPVVSYSAFDGRIRTMEWQNLPNKYPYSGSGLPISLMSILSQLPGHRGQIKLLDLTGDTTDTTEQNVIFINLETKFAPGPASATANLKYEYIRLTYALV